MQQLKKRDKRANAADPALAAEAFPETLGSFSSYQKIDDEFDAMYPSPALPTPPLPSRPVAPADLPPIGGRFGVPIAIGRRG